MIKINDIIDIIVLSISFFLVLKFIFNRRAARLAVGILILGGIMVLSQFFNLRGTAFIYEWFYQAGMITFIIMFQPELRAALEKLGNAPINNIKNISTDHKSSSYVANSIGILTKTAVDLSYEKTGALIVIERDSKLSEYIRTGTFINAQLSSQLLKNLFFNKSPLHDGAVILRNFRVYAAACVLPLSSSEDLDESMGTRHRAALGISEISDSVVIVVSEETGKISIAVEGEMIQGLNEKTRRKELSKLLIPSTNPKNNNPLTFISNTKQNNENKEDENERK